MYIYIYIYIYISTGNKNKIIAIFEKMNNVLPQINGNRKRMIDITYIMKQI